MRQKFKKHFFKILSLGLLPALCFSACDNGKSAPGLLASRSQSLSAGQKSDLLPNRLFEALADKESESLLRDIIDQEGQYLFSLNKEGDTALGLAIKFYNLKGALFIAGQLSSESLSHVNHKGEGYVYLASQKGYVELIQLLADRFYNWKSQDLFLDYEFSDLDLKTNEGERALHVAKNYLTAEALEREYWRGALEYPLRKFQYLKNSQGQTFLHTAVRDQNSDLLRWGVKKNCASPEKWERRAFYEKYMSYFWQGLQSYGKEIWLDWDDLINTQDNEGLTALSFSSRLLFLEGIRILSSCQWTDYLLPDSRGNTPLQNFLLALDGLKQDQGTAVQEAFILLMESQTRLSLSGVAGHINSVNGEGETSLHISARLADPFFYNRLKKYGDIESKNQKGETPREIFSSRQKSLGPVEI